MEIINTPNINEARKKIQKLKKENKKIIIRAQDEEFNRKILENKDIDIFLSPELHQRKERLKQRDSGMNEVLCKLAAKNNIKIGIDIGFIIKKQGKEKALIISRLMQNIKLFKKTGVKIMIFPENKYPKQDTMSFLLTLKSSTSLAKEATK
jgi:ribonuclease P/MRP protein subunit RPP1